MGFEGRFRRWQTATLTVLTAILAIGSPGLGVAMAAPEDDKPTPDGPPSPDSGLQSAISTLEGAWRGDNHTLRIARVELPEAPHALYVELVRSGAEIRPLVSEVWMLFRKDGDVAARVLHPPAGSPLSNRLVGCWAYPTLIPRLTPRQFDPVLDLVDTEPSEGVTRLVSQQRGAIFKDRAIETTYDVRADGDSIVWRRTGYNEEGQIVWGDEPLRLEPFDQGEVVKDAGYGVTVIELRPGIEDSPEATDGDTVAAEFDAYLATGQQYYSTRRGELGHVLVELPGQEVSPGWTLGARGMKEGMIRRVIVPPRLAKGRYEQGIPEDLYVFYDIEIVSIRDNTPDGTDEVVPFHER